jgi:hypothetical protein
VSHRGWSCPIAAAQVPNCFLKAQSCEYLCCLVVGVLAVEFLKEVFKRVAVISGKVLVVQGDHVPGFVARNDPSVRHARR